MENTRLHTDKELFSLIALGNEQAFEQLFLDYAQRLKPVIVQVVKNEGAVNDIIQDIFLGLWLDRHALNEIENPRKWIFRLMYNRCFRWLQRQATQTRVHREIAAGEQYANIEGTEQVISLSETATLIRQAINELAPQAKKIYSLKREEGLKISEIAAQLGITEQSVKNSLHRSGKAIKEYLAGYDIYIPLILVVWG